MQRPTLYSTRAYAEYRKAQGLPGASRASIRNAIADGRLSKSLVPLLTMRGQTYAVHADAADEELFKNGCSPRRVGRHLSDEDHQALRRLHGHGLYDREIAERLCCAKETVRKHRAILGLPANPRRRS